MGKYVHNPLLVEAFLIASINKIAGMNIKVITLENGKQHDIDSSASALIFATPGDYFLLSLYLAGDTDFILPPAVFEERYTPLWEKPKPIPEEGREGGDTTQVKKDRRFARFLELSRQMYNLFREEDNEMVQAVTDCVVGKGKVQEERMFLPPDNPSFYFNQYKNPYL